MKWINNEGIKFLRGDYEGLIAKFDDVPQWFCMRGLTTQQTQKSAFKLLGEYLQAEKCEVKHMWDEDGNCVEEGVVIFQKMYSGEYKFYVETDQGLKPL